MSPIRYNFKQMLSPEELQRILKLPKDKTREALKEYKKKAYEASLFSCVKTTYYHNNNNTVLENAEQIGLTKKLNKKDKILLRKISNNTAIARVFYLSSKYSWYTLIATAIVNLGIDITNKDLYNTIQPEETSIFIYLILFTLFCSVIQDVVSKDIDYKIGKIIESKTR